MKYGPVLTYRDIEEAKKLIGKIVIATDILNKIENYPKQCLTSFLLDEVSIGVDSPFIVTSCDSKTKDCFQFIREVIEEKTTRRMTERELAKWCAEGKGEWKLKNAAFANNSYAYDIASQSESCSRKILIRAWDEEEWHEPLVEAEE